MTSLDSIFKHKIIVGITFIGIVLFYLWQPITDFIDGSFNQNLMMQLDTETIKQSDTQQLLIIHAKPINRGNVPIEIGDKGHPGTFTLEIRKIDKTINQQWVDYSTLPKVANINMLKNYPDGYILEQGTIFDEVQAISLPNGNYWIKAVINYGKDYFVDQSTIVELSNKPNKAE